MTKYSALLRRRSPWRSTDGSTDQQRASEEGQWRHIALMLQEQAAPVVLLSDLGLLAVPPRGDQQVCCGREG